MTDAEKTELKKEILYEEHEAGQKLGLCAAKLRGIQIDLRTLVENLSTLLMHLNIKSVTRNTEASRSTLETMIPTLRKHGLTALEESCREAIAAQESALSAYQRKHEAGML